MKDAVKQLQTGLLGLGFNPGLVDGIEGPKTLAAAQAYVAARTAPKATPAAVAPDELPWLAIARGLIGLREIPGPAHEAEIVKMFADAGHAWVRDDETAWCAAFVGAVLKRAKLANTGSLAARSYEGWGQKLSAPIYGCVGVKKRAGGAAWQGHLGFVVGASTSTIYLLGGNQDNAVAIDGFARREFTAFRWPTEVPIPARPLALPTSLAGAASRVSEA
ncbi:TIGR02594 family protein [Cereibacter sphaeroides]|uniref:NlpC/P60 family protein n=1 Tax=Cereibacter sphaeroides TaxID=1063 RepID=UPI000F51C5F2|nr:TIGR02594 family protein [Cereibacter sphaeroides]AZB63875.1 TIGR02594 family protein [Cereibacter sphaeroides]AZB68203.1 TIGR02594 family protein [Cereibacter sphaeroides]